ncbi:14858_t:CDS:2 [Funneliformis geosporum]|uniref:6276_t:CDS:1 n=1 Tax=Funneliformis geosporum TaxID=1117311 RepID=A0A9W4WJK6_9GLOM|nr:14858_t:CDS:2 [Funneliformis geosporum]CAI2166487.1 6276_t:CDS:2 [Funneliformis geosporum]
MTKTPNAFLHYRNERIDSTQERTMVEHSRITGPKWNELGEKCKRKYYHRAEAAKIRKESEAGMELPIERTFIPGDDYSFIIETPNLKKRTKSPGSMIKNGEKSEKRIKGPPKLPKLQPAKVQPRETLKFIDTQQDQNDDSGDHDPVKKSLIEDEKYVQFNEFTMGTDYQIDDFIIKGALPPSTNKLDQSSFNKKYDGIYFPPITDKYRLPPDLRLTFNFINADLTAYSKF